MPNTKQITNYQKKNIINIILFYVIYIYIYILFIYLFIYFIFSQLAPE
jgi:hypothetical protein